jgi:hypothetical protein
MAHQLADELLEVDARMCSLHRVADALRSRVEDTRQAPGAVIDLARIEARAGYIAAMRHLHSELQKLILIVSKNGIEADEMHKAEIKAAQDGLSRAQSHTSAPAPAPAPAPAFAFAPKLNPDEGSPLITVGSRGNGSSAGGLWSTVVGGGKVMIQQVEDNLAGGMRRDVKIVGDLAVQAVVLPNSLNERREVLAAISPGELFYVPSWNHFAVRIAGHVFHANIGRVYRGSPPRAAGPVVRESLERVKACRRSSCGGRESCRYYHNPEYYPESSDTRNYMADSWLYTPAASAARYGTRRVGSNEFIESDLQAISTDDAVRFIDQTSHDILCSLILHRYVIEPSQKRSQRRRER